MKVLFLPHNIASQITYRVRALRELDVDARGLAPPVRVANNAELEALVKVPRSRPLAWAASVLRNTVAILRGIFWADVVHWYFAPALPGGLDIWWARLLRRKMIVDFCGSDIRNGELEAAENPYYAAALHQGYEYAALETAEHSRANQRSFAAAGCAVNTPSPSLVDYLVPEYFPHRHAVRSAVWLDDYVPAYPDPTCREVRIVHSPTAPVCKGSAAVERAIEAVRSRHALSYERVQGRPHREAQRLIAGCDLFLDQFVLGDYGVAAMEAMAYGKPVVCYIKPSLVGRLPADLPIVLATQEELPAVLDRLLRDGDLRRRLGEQGRAYVEKYHDARRQARELLDIYRNLPDRGR